MTFKLAELAYAKPADIAVGLPLGMTNAKFISEGPVQCFVADYGEDVVVAFRGTEADKIEDWMADLKFAMVPHLPSGGKIHHGFVQALVESHPHGRSARDVIHEEIVRRQPHHVYCIGHSFGGALAVNLAALLVGLNGPDIHFDVLGCPNVGNERFNRWLRERLAGYRSWVNSADIVTRIPPFGLRLQAWPPRVRFSGFYRRPCPDEYCDGDGNWFHDAPLLFKEADRIRAYYRDIGKPGVAALKAHYITAYGKVMT